MELSWNSKAEWIQLKSIINVHYLGIYYEKWQDFLFSQHQKI